jgi:hypothetical protein
MPENTDNTFNKAIPPLDGTNFQQWFLRIENFLEHKGLLKYCLNPEEQENVTATVKNKKTEACLILMNHLSVEAFDSVVTMDNSKVPHKLWLSIMNRFASQSYNNKARVWLKFMRLEWTGGLESYVSTCRKMLNEIALVDLGVPENVLCYSILAKLPNSMWNIVDSMVLNEELVSFPETTLAKLQEFVFAEESRMLKEKTVINQKENRDESAAALYQDGNYKKKITRGRSSCFNGKHNPNAPHSEEKCWHLHPELRPKNNYSSYKQHHLTEALSDVNPALLSVSAADAVCLSNECHPSVLKPTVADSGATHHMINSDKYIKIENETNLKVTTGNDINNLEAKGIGKAILNGEKIVLNDVLFVPKLNRNLVSIPRLFNNKLSIEKDPLNKNQAKLTVDDHFVLNTNLENNFFELENNCFDEINSIFSYLSCGNHADWHSRLGHPHISYLKKIFPDQQEFECEICKLSKMKHFPFKHKFKEVSEVLETIHMDVVGPFSTQSLSGAFIFSQL